MLWQYQRRQAETLEQVRTANSTLQAARAGLETEVVARTGEGATKPALDQYACLRYAVVRVITRSLEMWR